MKALILTGGFGTRLREVINDRPKVMAPIGGRPFLEFLFDVLRKNGILEVVLSVGYLGDYIKEYFGNGHEWGLDISYCEEARPLGTGGAVKAAAERFFQEPFLVINGDTLLDSDLRKIWEYHFKKSAEVTIAVSRREDVFSSGFVVLDNLGRVIKFDEKPKTKAAGLVNSGVYVFNPGILRAVKHNNRFSLEKDFFPKILGKNQVYGFRIKEDFIDIGTVKDYVRAQRLLAQKKQRVFEVFVPTRVSFAGGGTDLPEFFTKFSGAVVGGTVAKYAHLRFKERDIAKIRISLLDFDKEEEYPLSKFLPYDGSVFDLYKAAINRFRPKRAFELVVWGDFVAGSGLGSSSAICVGLIYGFLALEKKKMSREEIARKAIEIEREELGIPGGWQDQFLCSFGGLSFVEFARSKKVKIKRIGLKRAQIEELEKRFLLYYVGKRRTEKIQQNLLANRIKVDERTNQSLLKLLEIAKEIYLAFLRKDFLRVGKLLDESWNLKKTVSDKISAAFIDRLYEIAKKNGAIGGKLLGAGGGGYLLIYCQPAFKNKIAAALSKDGLIAESFKFDLNGPRILYES